MAIKSAFFSDLIECHNRVTLIGMSGLGKSYWSKAFESVGFKRFCCDDMIEARLLKFLARPDGVRLSLGQWMGFPFDKGYGEREALYLAFEVEVLTEIVAYLTSADPLEKIVVDTTGSAPYAGDDLLSKLKQFSFIIHLDTSEEQISKMLDRYISNPRPVLWGEVFKMHAGEGKKKALARSYRELLSFRTKMYLKYSHESVPFSVHRINEPHPGRLC